MPTTSAPCPIGGRRLALVMVIALSLCGSAVAGPEGGADRPAHRFDTSQAELMLRFLERAGQGEVDDELVAAVMAAPATALVIGQMNLMRRVTAGQYETILRSVRDDEAPAIAPADDSERAARGVAGLTENVWPALRWGIANTKVLAERLQSCAALDVYETARSNALRYLPSRVDIEPDVFIVMGGRAGAAALPGGEIYVDLLLLSVLDGLGRRPYSEETDLVGFISHEMHHIGYREILEDYRAPLDLDARDELVSSLLVSVVSEGSATYLVSGHRAMERATASDSGVGQLAGRGDELLAEVERVLAAIEAGDITDREHYDAATGFLLGSGPHMVGSLMLSRIDSGSGLDAVMAVMADPRRLLETYNSAVRAGAHDAGEHVFDPELAAAVASIGKRPQ